MRKLTSLATAMALLALALPMHLELERRLASLGAQPEGSHQLAASRRA